MVLNPEPHFRPISVRRYLEADSSTPRGRQSTYRVTHPPSAPATGSEEPIPMAAPRPAKRPRTTPTFLEGSNPRDPGRPEPHPIPDDDDVRVTPANSAALPVRSEDSGSDEDHAPPAPYWTPPMRNLLLPHHLHLRLRLTLLLVLAIPFGAGHKSMIRSSSASSRTAEQDTLGRPLANVFIVTLIAAKPVGIGWRAAVLSWRPRQLRRKTSFKTDFGQQLKMSLLKGLRVFT